MYYKIGISQLSPNQLSRLRNGHPVRVKLGSSHHIHLSAPQMKKLHVSHKKGSAYTVIFDPHQAQQHGSGLMGDIASHLTRAVKHHAHKVINPMIRHGKAYAHKGINTASGYAHRGLNKATGYAHRKLEEFPEMHGEGLVSDVLKGSGQLAGLIGGNGSADAERWLGGLGGIADTFGVGIKHHRKPRRHMAKGKGLLGMTLKGGGELANLIGGEGSGTARDVLGGLGDVANLFGFGLPHHKKRGGRKRGGALYPAGV